MDLRDRMEWALRRYVDSHCQQAVPLSLTGFKVNLYRQWQNYRQVFASSDGCIYAITGALVTLEPENSCGINRSTSRSRRGRNRSRSYSSVFCIRQRPGCRDEGGAWHNALRMVRQAEHRVGRYGLGPWRSFPRPLRTSALSASKH
jgi:hypothetical protein